ncbi:MAG: hypothetical protein MJA83_03345 [Gammaproteobacteria bacterium]|nr:hypothetical protein [Gammaproteobacteria bacterium]
MSNDDTFGFSEAFQKSIVAAALKDPSFLLQYDDVLTPTYFDYEYLTSVMRTAHELCGRLGQVPTKLSVQEELKEFCVRFNLGADESNTILARLEELYAIDGYDLPYLQDKVVEFGQRQALRVAVMDVISLLQKPRKNGEDSTTEKARSIMEKALRVGLESRDMGLDVYPNLLKIPDMAARSTSGLKKKIPTLFETWDKNTYGGPGRGEVWVVMALPGRGKTTLLVNLGAAALKSGYPVFHYTIGDLDKVDVAVRYAARLTGCTTYEVITRSDIYMRRAEKLSKYNPHLMVKYYPSGTVSMQHIRAHASKMRSVKELSPAVMIIDYPEELRPMHGRGGDLYSIGGDNYTMMGAMAYEFDCLLYAGSQVNRWKPQHPDDVVKMDNIAESWKKPQKADGILSWNMDVEEHMLGMGRIWFDKVRRQKSYYILHCTVDLHRMTISEAKRPPPDSE